MKLLLYINLNNGIIVTTVGYGDFSPTDDRSRIFTIFFVLVGLVFIFSIINDFAQSILQYAEKKALEKLDDDPTDLKVSNNHVLSKLNITVTLRVR